MYTNHQGLIEYPFTATFYHIGIDDSKPLDEQVEEKIVTFQTPCDVSERNNSISNDTITMFFPFDAEKEECQVNIGETVEVTTYGIIQRGRVLGVYPSQLGGVTVLCKRI
jgi:hypothetical protein